MKQTNLLSRYPELKNVIDDDISIGRHFETLHRELGKRRPKKEVVLSLSRQTYIFMEIEVGSSNT